MGGITAPGPITVFSRFAYYSRESPLVFYGVHMFQIRCVWKRLDVKQYLPDF